MPDVRILVTSGFIDQVPIKATFCKEIRAAVAELFGFDLSVIAVQLESYAPGCEVGRPPVVVAVSTNKKEERIPQQADLTNRLADLVKVIADRAIGHDVGQIKTRIDMVLRKTATVG